MKEKVLLVYPEIPATYWSLKHAVKFVGKKSVMPPLGLLTIASMLPDNFETKLVDLNVETLDDKDIEDSVLIFISAMIVQKDSFAKIIRQCKSHNKIIVAGGPYPTTSHNDIEGVDHFILNEAEITLPLFLEDYKNGRPKKMYRTEIKPDITTTPPPNYHIIDQSNYTCAALQFSRGCPYKCEFCDIIEMFGRKHRTKNIEQFINEMNHVYETGFRGPLFIVDDNFIGKIKIVKVLLKEIAAWQKERNFPFNLFTEASIDLAMDDELLNLMREAGFNSVFIGIETPDAETLKSTQKHQNLKKDILNCVINIQSHGIEVLGGFIVGFDSDPEDIFERQVDFIQKAGIPMAMIGILDALPNTQLYRRLKEEHRLREESSGNNTHDLSVNFIPKMQEEKLINGYKEIISEIYSPVNYFDRCITLLKRIPKSRTHFKPVNLLELRAFFLSIIRQTFSSYGLTYIKYIFKAVFLNFANFPLAVNFAIKGYHFFKITNEILLADEFTATLDNYYKSFKKEVDIIIKKANNNVAARVERAGFRIKLETEKKYQQLSKDMQIYLKGKMHKFDNTCKNSIEHIKEGFIISEKKNFPL